MTIKSLAAMVFLLVAAKAQTIPFQNAVFNDPFSGDNTLLDLYVETTCPQSVQVVLNVPANGGSPAVGGYFTYSGAGTGFGPTPFVGVIDSSNANTPESATVTYALNNDGSSTWTFTDFADFYLISSKNPANVPTNWDPTQSYFITVDIDDSLFPPGIVVLPPTHQIQVASDLDPSYANLFVVTQTNSLCQGPSGPHGDPMFNGFQGQVFQFHGLPDEHFNLISSPDVQLNSHFVYLSSGKCDYNDTECWTHPGTYMDVLGFSVGGSNVKIVAGTHDAGLRVWWNDAELPVGARVRSLSSNATGSLHYRKNGIVVVHTELVDFEVINSDMFMNIQVSLKSQELLRTGHVKHTVTDQNICKTNTETHNHQLIESTVAKKYPITTPLHGLMGQTWRNVKVCGRDWMGTVQDYLVSSVFSSDYNYNYYGY